MEDDKVGMTLQVIVRREGGANAEAIALFPNNAEGGTDAETTAFVVIRALTTVKEAMASP